MKRNRKSLTTLKQIVDQFQKAVDRAEHFSFQVEDYLESGEWDIWIDVRNGTMVIELAGPDCEVHSSHDFGTAIETFLDLERPAYQHKILISTFERAIQRIKSVPKKSAKKCQKNST